MDIIATATNGAPGVVSGRLSEEDCRRNFCEMHSPLEPNGARVEAERCYFCFDAPCIEACPTEIDIPGFIRMIGNHNPVGAAGLIFQENIMGGTCARACPVETLCEYACVRNQPDDRPVSIGLLQRYAVDQAMDQQASFFSRCAPSGKSVAVVGAGPAGLACAHRLAVLGHSVCIYEHRPKSGGLNEYGLAAYKMLDNFAQKEAEFIWGEVHDQYGPDIPAGLFRKLYASRLDRMKKRGLWPKDKPMPDVEKFVARDVLEPTLREMGYYLQAPPTVQGKLN